LAPVTTNDNGTPRSSKRIWRFIPSIRGISSGTFFGHWSLVHAGINGLRFPCDSFNSTYTIVEKIVRAPIGFLPPPTLRLYCFFPSFFGLGIKGSTISQSASETFHDFALICLSPLEKSIAKAGQECYFIYG